MIFMNLNSLAFRQQFVALRAALVIQALWVGIIIAMADRVCSQEPRLPSDGKATFEVSEENGVGMKLV